MIKKGTEIDGILQQTLSSKTNHDGDKFTLAEKDTFWHKIPPALRGGIIEGHLQNVTPAGPTHKATMDVIFDDVRMPDGAILPIHVRVISLKAFEAKTHVLRDTGIVIGAAVVGHWMAHKPGQHGGLAGAAAGFALVTTLKSDIHVPQGTLVELKLTENLVPTASVQPAT
ncbi:MAG TPA: hypothetical protein VKG44_01985 [Candidatus Baltobacteraceae bacterium]|nr:hypothetical protein [Candidatus Baltobacteraceae bacterium]